MLIMLALGTPLSYHIYNVFHAVTYYITFILWVETDHLTSTAISRVDDPNVPLRLAGLRPEQTLVRVGLAIGSTHGPEVRCANVIAATRRIPVLV